MKNKYLYLIIVAMAAGFVIREMFTRQMSAKKELQLQSERNKNNYAAKEIMESRKEVAKYEQERDQALDVAAMYRKDVDRQLIDLKALKSKLRQYEISDRSILYNTDRTMDSLYRAIYPEQDSLYRIRTAPGFSRP